MPHDAPMTIGQGSLLGPFQAHSETSPTVVFEPESIFGQGRAAGRRGAARGRTTTDDDETLAMVAYVRDTLANTRSELNDVTGQRDAFEHELALCEQDLRHALTRIAELCEQLEAVKAGLV